MQKKLSPLYDPLSVLSWMLMPSWVMLIAERGRPLIVAWRLPFGVETPGSRVTKSIALRDVIGRLRIWVVFSVSHTPQVCVWTISELDDTVTCSATPPTSIVALTLAWPADDSTTFWMTTVLKPCTVTVTVQWPVRRVGGRAPSHVAV